MEEADYNNIGRHRISARQIDELIGVARGLCADGSISEADVDYLRNWLVAHYQVTNHPMLGALFRRIDAIFADGMVDEEERAELFETLKMFTGERITYGEALKPSDLPFCNPPPSLTFVGRRYCLTGTFLHGRRKDCEAAVTERGGEVGSLTQKSNVLVVGAYATESWKHSAFGNKILKACEYRAAGLRISIVSEDHWKAHL